MSAVVTSSRPTHAKSDLTPLWQARPREDARAALIRQFGYLVGRTRQRIVPCVPTKLTADDIEQEGRIALLKAIDQFDPERKVKFESYAISMIRGAMLEYMRKEDWVPRSVRTKQKMLHRAEEALTLQHGREPTDEEVARYLEMTLDDYLVLKAEAEIRGVVSLDDVVGDSEHDDLDPLVIAESAVAPTPDPSEVLFRRDTARAVRWALDLLPPPERHNLQRYHFDELTLKAIAKEINRSESRSHQLHAQGMKRLREFLAPEFPEMNTPVHPHLQSRTPRPVITKRALAAWPHRSNGAVAELHPDERAGLTVLSANVEDAATRLKYGSPGMWQDAAGILVSGLDLRIEARRLAGCIPDLSAVQMGALSGALDSILPGERKSGSSKPEVEDPAEPEKPAQRGFGSGNAAEEWRRSMGIQPIEAVAPLEEAPRSVERPIDLSSLAIQAQETNGNGRHAATGEEKAPPPVAPPEAPAPRPKTPAQDQIAQRILVAVAKLGIDLALPVPAASYAAIAEECGVKRSYLAVSLASARRLAGIPSPRPGPAPRPESAPRIESLKRGPLSPRIWEAASELGIDLGALVSADDRARLAEACGVQPQTIGVTLPVVRRERGIPTPKPVPPPRIEKPEGAPSVPRSAGRQAQLRKALAEVGRSLGECLSDIYPLLAEEMGTTRENVAAAVSHMRKMQGVPSPLSSIERSRKAGAVRWASGNGVLRARAEIEQRGIDLGAVVPETLQEEIATACRCGTSAVGTALAELRRERGLRVRGGKPPKRAEASGKEAQNFTASLPTEQAEESEELNDSRSEGPAAVAALNEEADSVNTGPALHLAPDLSLPVECVTGTFGILAQKGAGKSYTASVLAEEMLSHGQQVVIIDPVGVWWGLRADGGSPFEDEGYKVPILGGEYGDLSLRWSDGEAVAELVAEERQSLILDLSALRKKEGIAFMADFAERLYELKAAQRSPLHLIIDEADLVAPEKRVEGRQRVLGAVDDLVRRGRARGIGVTLVSQRSAVLSKDVLSQIGTLIALRTLAPQDRAALDAWIEAHDAEEKRGEFMGSLASMAVGDAWVWSPSELDLFRRVHIRQRRTWDSSATPKAGRPAPVPPPLLPVDTEPLMARLRGALLEGEGGRPATSPAREALVDRVGSAMRDGILWADDVRKIAAETGATENALKMIAKDLRGRPLPMRTEESDEQNGCSVPDRMVERNGSNGALHRDQHVAGARPSLTEQQRRQALLIAARAPSEGIPFSIPLPEWAHVLALAAECARTAAGT